MPLPDVEALPEIDARIATSTGASAPTSAPPTEDAPAPPSPARARPHDATTWFPLPVPDELPSIDEMLTQSPWGGQPSPARAEPHDATAWLPLPDVDTLPEAAPPAPAGAPPPAMRGPAPAGASARRARPPRTARRMRPRSLLVAVLVVATLVTAGLGMARVVDRGSSVEMRVDGRRTSVDSGAATVAELLRDEGVRLGEFDRVVPGPRASLRDGLSVTVLRAFPITRDLDGDVQTVYTTYASPADYVAHDLDAVDIVIRSAPERLQRASTIILRTPHSGTLLVDDSRVDFDVPALNLKELLAQYSIDLGPEDYVLGQSGVAVGADARLVDGEQYSVIRVGREIRPEDESYSVPDERRPDASMAVGTSRVVQGSTGVMKVTYEIVHRNGDIVDRKVLSRVPTVPATPMVTYYGTKADPMWDKIAECETGGNWGMQGPLYSGGLGFYNQTWNAFGGQDFATNAGLASREEQIIVAERLRHSVGIGGWGCAHMLGYVR